MLELINLIPTVEVADNDSSIWEIDFFQSMEIRSGKSRIYHFRFSGF
jgi:hypothetical protein